MEQGHLSARPLVLSFIVVIVLACIVPSSAVSGPPIEGQSAPDFVLPGLLDVQTRSLKDLRGKVVLLNIWASWCTGCREEMEDLMAVQDRYGSRGFTIVAVNIDNSSVKAIDFMKSLEEKTRRKTGFILLYDKDKAVSKDYRQRGMPTSYLIDREGTLRKTYPGSFTKENIGALKNAIEEALK
jgi:thiol-disulfide isomerase/thioredoxin